MVDANSAYTAADFKHLAELDRFHLQMMEQPLNESDIYCHSLLHREIHTPICLDESIHTLHDAKVCGKMALPTGSAPVRIPALPMLRVWRRQLFPIVSIRLMESRTDQPVSC